MKAASPVCHSIGSFLTPSISNLRERAPFVIVVALTTAWLVVVAIYLARLGLDAAVQLPVNELSTLVVAVFAPLVGLWLVAAVLTQRGELVELRRRLVEMSAQSRHSLQQAETQSRAMLEMENQFKRSLSADTRRLGMQMLASHAAVLAERLGILKADAIDIAWARFGSGDTTAFVQSFLSHATRHPDLAQRMGEAVARDPQGSMALAGFVRRYDRLAGALADDKLALEMLDEGPLGQSYRIFRAAEQVALASADDGA